MSEVAGWFASDGNVVCNVCGCCVHPQRWDEHVEWHYRIDGLADVLEET